MMKRLGIITGITAFFIITSSTYVCANVVLPFYSTGFGGFTLILSFPLVVILETLLISYLMKKHNTVLNMSIWKECFKANLTSTIFGTFLSIILAAAVFSGIWDNITGYSDKNPIIFMRQIFLASYIITIMIEALSYQSFWPEKKYHIPMKEIWFCTFAANSLSYGTIGWFFAMGWLKEQYTSPLFLDMLK